MIYYESSNELMHHGIQGQKWGIRRYQNEDGSLKPAGEKRYSLDKFKQKASSVAASGKKKASNLAAAGKEKASNIHIDKKKAVAIGLGVIGAVALVKTAKVAAVGVAAVKASKAASNMMGMSVSDIASMYSGALRFP